MHQPGHAEITAELLVQDGRGAADLARWRGLRPVVGVRKGCGENRVGLERLGWSVALADHRPFLAHGELEAFFGTPSGLYELLASVLGLEDLTSAAARLTQARLRRDSAFRAVKRVCRPCWPSSKMQARSGPGSARGRSASGPGPGRRTASTAPRAYSSALCVRCAAESV